MTRRRVTSRSARGVVCARGPEGLTDDNLAALRASVEAYMDTRCHAPSQVPVPAAYPGTQPRTYRCGRLAGHDPGEGHRWPEDPDRPLIVAWCDWNAP